MSELVIPDLTIETPLAEISKAGITKKNLPALEDGLGLLTVRDLVNHFPRRYEDRTRFVQFPDQPMDEPVCLRGEVTDANTKFAGRRRFFEATIEPPGGDILGNRIVLRWFNMPFMSKAILVGHDLVVYGRPKMSGPRLVMDHPDYEILDRGSPLSEAHMDRIVPVYGLASGINQKTLRGLMYRALESLTDEDFPQILPPGTTANDLTRAAAVRETHFPKSFETLEAARLYLALEEFTLLQFELLKRRRASESSGGVVHCGPGYLLEDFLKALPFQPTDAQTRTIGEIRADLNSNRPMIRMLQGDVGAGKTLVAAGAILLAVEAGFDAALMAPTQILAEQHYRTFKEWFDPLDITVNLKTGAKKTAASADDLPLFSAAGSGGKEGTLTVGTHALIHGTVEQFPNGLGLVVIDEQHKFGVDQRAKLIALGNKPDVLVMTATPIPRTLTLAFYGDLDVSILDELPKGRQAIITGIRDNSKIKEATKFVREHLENGRQAYIVYPLIEESEKVKSAAATKEFDSWVKRFDSFECGLLHGKMSADEKEMVMADFRDGKTDVLVSTTVIEVGVDVPNANMMIIFNAERFGLAQIHQLRGRTGRGEHKSFCILMCDPEKSEARLRMKILEETRDGFLIAEEDLRQRGPGEVLGTQQSGLPDLKFVEYLGDSRLVEQSRQIAEQMLDAR